MGFHWSAKRSPLAVFGRPATAKRAIPLGCISTLRRGAFNVRVHSSGPRRHPILTRRDLIRSAFSCSASAALPSVVSNFADEEPAVELCLQPGTPGITVPSNFIGLGYEMSSAARPGLLSMENTAYVQLARTLAKSGVLRLGGIVADYTSYASDGPAAFEPKHTVITRANLEQIRGFLDAIGWTAIWSLNFGRGTLPEAIVEATDVARILGPRLLAVELGNEVENYSHGATPLRPPPYSFSDYRAEYSRWHAAIKAAVPNLRFAAPDTAGSVEWVEQMATNARGEVQLLTTHYYRGDQKQGTLDQLMRPDPALKHTLERLRHASVTSGLPWRMCETNSFYGGGRPGLSNTLAGALWTLDYMLLLAQAGCAGVNLETGVNQLGFISSYSPIQDDGAGHNSAGVPYYGMLAFAAALADSPEILPLQFEPNDESLSAHVLGAGQRARNVVLLNRSAVRSRRISLAALQLDGPTMLRLAGPSLESTTGISFGGATVSPAGSWAAATAEPLLKHELRLAPASAVVIRSAGQA